MRRVPEPELMDDEVQARAYALADFEEPHSMFVELFAGKFPELAGDFQALDIGCGSADITLRFANAFPRCRIDGVDGAEAMLDYGHDAVNNTGFQRQVTLIYGILPKVALPGHQYDAVISNSLLHHLKNPQDLWQTIKRCGRRGAAVFVMDLLRPINAAAARGLTDRHTAGEPEILQRDFFNSLCAAYRKEEVQQQLHNADLGELSIEIVSDRHFIVFGKLP